MKKLVLLLLVWIWALEAGYTQIQFFEGSFGEVLEKARAEQKKVFIDFYTVWCGPCKQMAKQVFTDPEVAAYFNEKFVSYQINAEDKAFATVVKKYKVQAYPTLLLLDASGKVFGVQAGAVDADRFLRWAKTQNGDMLSFEAMYEKWKSDKTNEQLIQAILLGAPDFMMGLEEGSNYDRWTLRIERLYQDYRKKKALAGMMNPTDLAILMTYHPQADKNDEVLDYLAGHYNEIKEKAGNDLLFKYFYTLSTGQMQALARKGDLDYLKCLERLKGDLKPLYDSVMNFNGTDAYTGMKCLYDGDYYIYSRKDVGKFLKLRDQYFEMLGVTVTPGEYREAVDALYEVQNGKLAPEVAVKCIEWLTKGLQKDMDPGSRMEMLLMLGDCHKMRMDKENARKCYNQAYALSLQFNRPALSARVKAYGAELDNE